MQNSLFGDGEDDLSKAIEPATLNPDLITLAQALPPHVRLGTSSWSSSGWTGLVWKRDYKEGDLSRYGLNAYSQHPLFRTVSVDHGLYQAKDAAQFAKYAAQVSQDFRFVVKAPRLTTDALVRDRSGRGMQPNPHFLDAADTVQNFVKPALDGLGHKLGALVFQIGPLPEDMLMRMPEMINRLHRFLKMIPDIRQLTPDGVIAVEVRNDKWLTPEFVEVLRATGATYCLGLNAKMPLIAEQLPTLRALWPSPLVCRWNLNPVHGAYGFENAGEIYSPFNKMVDPDVETRAKLAQVISGVANKGQNIYVTVSNTAEGCAPLSIIELAKAIQVAPK